MSAWDSELRHGFRLGDWIVRPDQCLIEGESGPRHLEPKLMEVLLYLAMRPGEVVRRDQLIDDVWRTVVNDEVLSRAISLLRAHLGDDPKLPRYILTVPKAGYRLIIEPGALEIPAATLPDEPVAAVHAVSEWPTVAPDTWPDASLPAARHSAYPGYRWARRVAMIAIPMALLIALWVAMREAPYGERIPGDYASLGEWFDAIGARENAPGPITAVAVLPFQDLGAAGTGEHLDESLTDELILALSQVSGLKVVARRSVIELQNQATDIRSLGQHFGVDAILEGTVTRHDDRLRVTAQLGGTRDGFVLWSNTYDEPIDDVFALQRTISDAITRELQAIAAAELHPPAAESVAPGLEAYQLFLNGRYLLKLRGASPLRQSIRLFEQALASDPAFTRAHLGLVQAIALLPFYDPGVDEEAMYRRALKTLDGLLLDNSIERAEAESIRGFIADRRWQWREAEQHHTRSLALNPADPNAYNLYSQHLAAVGRLQDAREAARRGAELDAVSAVTLHRLAVTQMWLDDNLGAAENFAAGMRHGFSSDASFGYLVFLHRMGRWDEMQRLFSTILQYNGYDPGWAGPLFAEFRSRDQLAEAIAACEDAIVAENFPMRAELPTWILLGDVERAYQTLQRDPAEKRYLDIEFLWTAESTILRADARFAALTSRFGLDQYWEHFGPPDTGL